MTDVIMPQDVIHMHRLGDARHLVQRPRIVPQVRVTEDASAVALEMQVTDAVKADRRGEQPPVRLGQVIPRQPVPVSKTGLRPAQSGKQRHDRRIMRGPARGESGLADAVVHLGMNPRLQRIDGRAQGQRPEISAVARQPVKCRIEHADDPG